MAIFAVCILRVCCWRVRDMLYVSFRCVWTSPYCTKSYHIIPCHTRLQGAHMIHSVSFLPSHHQTSLAYNSHSTNALEHTTCMCCGHGYCMYIYWTVDNQHDLIIFGWRTWWLECSAWSWEDVHAGLKETLRVFMQTERTWRLASASPGNSSVLIAMAPWAGGYNVLAYSMACTHPLAKRIASKAYICSGTGVL